jgi:hypothetical protein
MAAVPPKQDPSIPDGLYWHEHNGQWERIEVADGVVYWLMQVGLPITVAQLGPGLLGPLRKPKFRGPA